MNHWVVALGFVAACVLLGTVAARILLSRAEILDDSGNQAHQLVRILEASISATFQSAEILLDAAGAEAMARDRGAARSDRSISSTLMETAERWDFVQSVSFIGANGLIEDAAYRDPSGTLVKAMQNYDVSGFETFLAHARSEPSLSSIYFSEVRPGFATRNPVILVTKGVWADDGRLIGVASVAVALSEFEDMFTGLLPEVEGAIALFRADATLLLSVPPRDLKVGENFSQSRLFSVAVREAQSGVYDGPGIQDGLMRQIAFHAAPRYPFVVTVTLALESVLAEWRRSSLINAGAAIFGALMICGLSIVLAMRIARQRVAQLGLIQSEQSLAESQRMSGIGHFERDLQTNAYVWSENLYRMHGVSPATFVPGCKQFLKLVVEEDRQRVDRDMRHLISRLLPGNIECRVRKPDGQVRTMRYGWRVFPDPSGQRHRIFGVGQDVTDLREAEAALRENEARLTDILECSSDFIWESDAAGNVVQFTGAGIDLFQPITGLHGSQFYAMTEEASDLHLLKTILRNRRQFRSLMIPARGINGSIRWVRVSGNPLFDAQGRFQGYRGAGTDVTESRRQLQLLEQQRKGEALGRLAGGLAHEVNNLLQPVLIYSSSGISGTDPASPTRTYFERIMRATERATNIVRNVLAFARHGPPRREEILLSSAINDVLDLSSAILPPGVTFDIADESLNRTVRVDRTGFAQVILNLITNAVEAMDGQGFVRITASNEEIHGGADTPAQARPGKYCVLRVADTGPGIPADDLGQVFDPFFTTKPPGQGTGLGLSVVAGIVKTWGGSVSAANDPAGGAIFSIYLPEAERGLQAAQ